MRVPRRPRYWPVEGHGGGWYVSCGEADRLADRIQRAATKAMRDKKVSREEQYLAYWLAAELEWWRRLPILGSLRMAVITCAVSTQTALEGLSNLCEVGLFDREFNGAGYSFWPTYFTRHAPKIEAQVLHVRSYAEIREEIARSDEMGKWTPTSASKSSQRGGNISPSAGAAETGGASQHLATGTGNSDEKCDGGRAYTRPDFLKTRSFGEDYGIWVDQDAFRRGNEVGKSGHAILCAMAAGHDCVETLRFHTGYARETVSRRVSRLEKLGFVRRVAGQRLEIIEIPEGDNRLCMEVMRAEADRETMYGWALALAYAKVSNRWVAGFVTREYAAGSTQCEWCGGPGGEVHHVFPRFLGGPDTPCNLANVCPGSCHEEMYAKWREAILWPLEKRTLTVNFQEMYEDQKSQALREAVGQLPTDVGGKDGSRGPSAVRRRFEQRAAQDPKYALTVAREFKARYASAGFDVDVESLLDVVAEQFAQRGDVAWKEVGSDGEQRVSKQSVAMSGAYARRPTRSRYVRFVKSRLA